MKPIIFLLPFLGAASLSANILITPTSIATNGISEVYPAENLINDSGLSGTADGFNYRAITHSAASTTTAWTTNTPNGGTGDYFDQNTPGQTPVFTFTLPSSSTVNGLVYWGYHFTGNPNRNEAREFFVEFSQDGGNTFPESTTVGVALSDFTVTNAQTLPFPQDYIANTIRVSLTDNHFEAGSGGGDRVGVGEIKFVEIIPAALEVDPIIIESDGSNADLSATLNNLSTGQSITVTGVTIEGTNADLFTINTIFPIEIPADGSETIDLAFTPQGAVVELDARLLITIDPSDATAAIGSVTGFIRDPAGALTSTTAPAPIASGSTGAGTITFENNGAQQPLILNGDTIVFSSGGAFTLPDLATNPVTIPPGEAGEITYQFDATGLASGTYFAVIDIYTNDLQQPVVQLEIQAVVEKGSVPASLVGWWTFDGNAADASGFQHPFVEVGLPTYDAPGATASSGTSVTFDGASSISIPQTGVLNPDDFTVTMWASPDNLAGFQSLITSRNDTTALDGRIYGYILYMDNTGDWNFWNGDGTPGWVQTKNATNDPVAGEWQHLAITYSRATGTKTLYLNGEVLATQENVPLLRNLTNDLHIGSGADTGNQFFYQGKLDELAIFCEVLTQEQIMDIMDNGVSSFAGLDETVAITSLDFNGSRVTITSTSGLRSGVNYHLESGSSLDDFQPVPDTNFTVDSLGIPSIFTSDPKLFVRIVEGPGPVQ